MNHPFKIKYQNNFDHHPFDIIKNEHFQVGVAEGIKKAKDEVNSIVNQLEKPTFANTIESLEWSGQLLDRVTTVMYNLNSAETNEELQNIIQEVTPALTKHSNDILLNEKLFHRVKTVFDNNNETLNLEQQRLLENTYRAFVRNGALLNEDQKKQLRVLNEELAQLSLHFGRNVLQENNKYQKHITDEALLSGINNSAIEQAKELANSKNMEGWIFTLDFPSYYAIMTYADSRELRKEIFLAYHSKSFKNDELDNQKIIKDIVKKRQQKAELLGYDSHADFVLERRMAKNPITVKEFLNVLLDKALPFAKKELQQLQSFAKEISGLDTLERWDMAYYAEKLKTKLYEINNELLKPYFQLEKVIDGVFIVAEKLFGLHFINREDISVYHKDVKVFEVRDDYDNYVALFYADFFPRPGKRQGAWMTSYKSQYIKDGENHRPHVSIVCNFTKPVGETPSLLTFEEVTTLYHEFGHALHGMLANTTYPSMSGTNVFWDFVELPSQMMENWCYESECLNLFAKHYQTGENIPMEFVERIKNAAQFNAGLATIRQIGLGFIDMNWHSGNVDENLSVKDVELKAQEGTDLFPPQLETCTSTQFSHIFQGGYASGYYSYKWAEVLDADAFEYFKENGIFNKTIAQKFKDTILSQGGTVDSDELYRQFRGKDADTGALLRRSGLGG